MKYLGLILQATACEHISLPVQTATEAGLGPQATFMDFLTPVSDGHQLHHYACASPWKKKKSKRKRVPLLTCRTNIKKHNIFSKDWKCKKKPCLKKK